MTETLSADVATATDVVGRRLLGALYREDIADARAARWDGDRIALAGRWWRATRHAGDRIEIAEPVTDAPVDLLRRAGLDSAGLATELADAVTNLAVAYGQRAVIDAQLRATGAADLYALAERLATADEQAWFYERLATEGHNLHPCGRTRLGWSPDDLLRYDQEAPGFPIGFLGVRADRHVGDDVGAWLRARYPGAPEPPPGYLSQPVHPWQAELVAQRYPGHFADQRVIALPGSIDAVPTTALRTVMLAADHAGQRRYLKLSLDIQVTSTRRSISVASTRNGPLLSRWLCQRLAEDPALGRVILLDEVAGAAVDASDATHPLGARDMAAIVRAGLSGRTATGEVVVPAAALAARSPLGGRTVLAELVDRHAAGTGVADPALDFLTRYAELLLPPVLHLASRYGIGLEAHLQNCLPLFIDGTPHRMALRDLAGLRLHRPRFQPHAGDVALWPGSVIGTDDEAVLLAKVAYTAFQAHLGELVIRLGQSHGLPEARAWSAIRRVVDGVPGLRRTDHAFLTAPTVPHKALLRMRVAGSGSDIYLPVRNPLYG